MSQKYCLSALAAFFGIVALMMAVPGVSHATVSAYRADFSRDPSPGIVVAENDVAENEQPAASADSDSNSDSDSKDSDDETADDDKNNDNDQSDQQSAGNEQVAPQFGASINRDNDADDSGDAGEAGQAPQMNAYPQQINPYQ